MSEANAGKALRRLAVVGPVIPFRSGISQHTTCLARALNERCELLVISFSRQYPGWLFPGESDRDPESPLLTDPPALYDLDSLAPWAWRRTAARIREN